MRYELTPCQLNRLNDYIRHLRLAACLIDMIVHDIAKDARPGLRGHTPHRGRGGSPLPPARTGRDGPQGTAVPTIGWLGRDGPQGTAVPTTKRVAWGDG